MKKLYYIILMLLVVGCVPRNRPSNPTGLQVDSVYTFAKVQWHGDYYNSGMQVFSIDLLSEGLSFDSTQKIVGTGYNLYFSDLFLASSDSLLQEGVYRMDTTAGAFTFLPYMYFEGNITGCYLLEIEDSRVKRIIPFVSGEVEVLDAEQMHMDIRLYTEDKKYYHAQAVSYISEAGERTE